MCSILRFESDNTEISVHTLGSNAHAWIERFSKSVIEATRTASFKADFSPLDHDEKPSLALHNNIQLVLFDTTDLMNPDGLIWIKDFNIKQPHGMHLLITSGTSHSAYTLEQLKSTKTPSTAITIPFNVDNPEQLSHWIDLITGITQPGIVGIDFSDLLYLFKTYTHHEFYMASTNELANSTETIKFLIENTQQKPNDETTYIAVLGVPIDRLALDVVEPLLGAINQLTNSPENLFAVYGSETANTFNLVLLKLSGSRLA